MNYVSLDRRRLPVGSWPVESAVRRIVNLRFKAPSIFWEEDVVAEPQESGPANEPIGRRP